MVNYTRKNCGIATEKLDSECDKNISAAKTNLHQQSSFMKSLMILLTISGIP